MIQKLSSKLLQISVFDRRFFANTVEELKKNDDCIIRAPDYPPPILRIKKNQ